MTDDDNSHTATARRRIHIACLLGAIVLLVSVPIAGATAASTTQSTAEVPTEPAFVVELDEDGSARTTLTVTFDLTTDSERAAFTALRENTTARERRIDQFASRMEAVAATAQRESGREMGIRNPQITFTEEGDTGIVALSVTWDGLAKQDGDRLVVQEPFESGFSVDRTVRIVAPDGYELSTVTPSPTDRTGTTATWSPGTKYDGFEATLTSTQDDSIPGFGAGVALLAILLGTVGLSRRDVP